MIHAWLEDTVAIRPRSKWRRALKLFVGLQSHLKSNQLSTSSSTRLLSRPIITSGNVLLVQFVSDLSVTSDGFLARYTSIRPGSQIPAVDAGAGTRSVPPRPAVKPVAPERPAATQQPPVPSAKDVPTERPKPVKPARGRGQGTTGQDGRVAVTRPNGKKPGGCRYVHAMLVCQCAEDGYVTYIFLCILYVFFFSPSKSSVCQSL